MDKLIDEIFEIIKDYRSDEALPNVGMTKSRIKRWIEQFEPGDQEFILTEVKNIFSKRYLSKESVKVFLKGLIEILVKDLKYTTTSEFLQHAVFLDLQPEGKSQKKMLKLLKELLKAEYNVDIENCGKKLQKHYVYIDDLLCTGNTLFRDIKQWSGEIYSDKKTNLDRIKDGSIDLIFAFVFKHEKNYRKKKAEFKYKIDPALENNHSLYRSICIDNTLNAGSKLDFLFPLEQEQPPEVIKYHDAIVSEVDKYAKDKNYGRSLSEFYRTAGTPEKEVLFSSRETRQRFENIMLLKGIEILGKAHTSVKNIRALGFSLPSQKDFGFGTLCFTWRNIANNTPLVFWYSGGQFFPLFVKNQTNN